MYIRLNNDICNLKCCSGFVSSQMKCLTSHTRHMHRSKSYTDYFSFRGKGLTCEYLCSNLLFPCALNQIAVRRTSSGEQKRTGCKGQIMHSRAIMPLLSRAFPYESNRRTTRCFPQRSRVSCVKFERRRFHAPLADGHASLQFA